MILMLTSDRQAHIKCPVRIVSSHLSCVCVRACGCTRASVRTCVCIRVSSSLLLLFNPLLYTFILISDVISTQQAIFRAEGQCRKQTILLKGITQGEVDPGEEMESVGEITNIPPVVPSHLGAGCKNIDLKYLLTV